MSDLDKYSPFEVDQHIKVKSNYHVGKLGCIFYNTLKENQEILGVKCDQCNKVYWPPRSTCGKCFSLLEEKDLQKIGPVGTVETYTQVLYEEPMHPRKAPFIYAVIKLDGADCGIAHFLDDIDIEDVEVGMCVKPIFNEDGPGNILDIKGFIPAE